MPHYIRSNSLCNYYALQMIKINAEKKEKYIKLKLSNIIQTLIPLTRLSGTRTCDNKIKQQVAANGQSEQLSNYNPVRQSSLKASPLREHTHLQDNAA